MALMNWRLPAAPPRSDGVGRLTSCDMLVVWKLDRLSRSLKDLLLILEWIGAAGAGFRSLIRSIGTFAPAVG